MSHYNTDVSLIQIVQVVFRRLSLNLAILHLPYHTANGKTVPAVIVIVGSDIRRGRNQEVTVRSRASSSRPPEAIRDAYDDAAIRAIVEARTEKRDNLLNSWPCLGSPRIATNFLWLPYHAKKLKSLN